MVLMEQADELVISGLWKRHRVALPVCQWAAIHAARSIFRAAARSCAWTADREGREHLVWRQKRHCVRFIGCVLKRYRVAGMNPKLVRQESDNLQCLVLTLGADLHSPILCRNQCWNQQ